MLNVKLHNWRIRHKVMIQESTEEYTELLSLRLWEMEKDGKNIHEKRWWEEDEMIERWNSEMTTRLKEKWDENRKKGEVTNGKSN